MALTNKSLKWGVFTSPQSGDKEFEMYIVENITDLNALLNAFPSYKANPFKIVDTWVSCLERGQIVILHSSLSWCTENTTGDTHPSSHNRVRLGERI